MTVVLIASAVAIAITVPIFLHLHASRVPGALAFAASAMVASVHIALRAIGGSDSRGWLDIVFPLVMLLGSLLMLSGFRQFVSKPALRPHALVAILMPVAGLLAVFTFMVDSLAGRMIVSTGSASIIVFSDGENTGTPEPATVADLATLAGTGPEGRIVKRDVLAAEAVAQASTAAAPPSATGELSVKGTVPLKGMRGAIARRMTQSLQTSAQLSHFSEVDATGLLKARKSFIADADAYGTRVSVNAFVVKAIALACQAVPIANSAIVDDQIVLWNEVNVGIAVSLPGRGEWDSGLIVPVLRNAERKGLVQIDTELRDLATRAREGRLVPGETEGGTITLSPTAAMGGEAMYSWSTPVLNLPQALIVQPGMIMPRAVVHKGKIKQREMMPLSVTFDHRILDGDPVASFVVRLRRCLQAPELMLA